MNLSTPEQAQQRICDVLESLAKQYEMLLAYLSKTFELSPIEENALLLCFGLWINRHVIKWLEQRSLIG
jgi:hypothetical protein